MVGLRLKSLQAIYSALFYVILLFNLFNLLPILSTAGIRRVRQSAEAY